MALKLNYLTCKKWSHLITILEFFVSSSLQKWIDKIWRKIAIWWVAIEVKLIMSYSTTFKGSVKTFEEWKCFNIQIFFPYFWCHFDIFQACILFERDMLQMNIICFLFPISWENATADITIAKVTDNWILH